MHKLSQISEITPWKTVYYKQCAHFDGWALGWSLTVFLVLNQSPWAWLLAYNPTWKGLQYRTTNDELKVTCVAVEISTTSCTHQRSVRSRTAIVCGRIAEDPCDKKRWEHMSNQITECCYSLCYSEYCDYNTIEYRIHTVTYWSRPDIFKALIFPLCDNICVYKNL